MKSARRIAATVLLTLLASCSDSKIQESALIGSWQWNLPGNFVVVSTYTTDHTFTMTFPNDKRMKGFEIRGEWTLIGNELSSILKAASGTNEVEIQNAVLFPPDLQKVKIVKLSETEMRWRGEAGSLELNRVKN
jgi:hypothetical protein